MHLQLLFIPEEEYANKEGQQYAKQGAYHGHQRRQVVALGVVLKLFIKVNNLI
jgi:hypothetical protein